MNMSKKLLTSIVFSSLLLSGCVSKVTEHDQFSGFLPNYDDLRQTTSAGGQPVLRWVSPDFKPGAYTTVVFNQLELYPAPKATDRVNLKTLEELQTFTSTAAKNVLAQRYKVLPNQAAVPAGSRAIIMRIAVTGVSASTEGMQWYEILPLAAVIGTVSAATGHRDQNTELFLEAYYSDASTGMPLVKVVRKVFGKNVANERQAITANDFKQTIQGLGSDLSAFIK